MAAAVVVAAVTDDPSRYRITMEYAGADRPVYYVERRGWLGWGRSWQEFPSIDAARHFIRDDRARRVPAVVVVPDVPPDPPPKPWRR